MYKHAILKRKKSCGRQNNSVKTIENIYQKKVHFKTQYIGNFLGG